LRRAYAHSTGCGSMAAGADLDSFDEAVTSDGLQDDAGGTGLERFAGVALGRGPAVEQEGDARCGLGEGTDQVDAATIRQAVVDDGDIGPVIGDRCLAVAQGPDGRKDAGARFDQEVTEKLS
jgi:hypothetical protein